jgi:hypothetical protein
MKVTISESQFKRMVDNSNRWGLIGISEAGKPKLSPEDEDKKIEEIINSIKNNEEFPFINKNLEYAWLNRGEKNGKQKFKDALNKIRRIKKYKENERIGEIIKTVTETGTISTRSTDYGWLDSGARRGNQKFERILNKIREIEENFENNRIGKILNTVEETGKYNKDDYEFLRNGTRRKNDSEKFENAINKIREIEEHFENKRIVKIINSVKETGVFSSKSPDYQWLDSGARRGNQKFKNVLNNIKKILDIRGRKIEWRGEILTKQILEDDMGFTDIPSLGQYTIDDCRNSLTCREYKFDVYLPYNKTNYDIIKNIPIKPGEPDVPELQQTGIIFEYDGKQHFEARDFFGGEEAFIEQIHKDLEKNSYCKDKIKLVRIPYTSNTRDKIERDIISALKNPDTFVLTGDYPKAGWNK